ncbi:phage tail assembly protein [Guyparkeria sp. 1SP6A2]|nr:phage tail assembly protein [Guyparkeria sp. 1SP6A2]
MTKAATSNRTVDLSAPLKRGEETVKSVVLRKPATGELRGLALTDIMRMEIDALTTIIPRISTPALTEEECRRMDVADLTNVGVEILGFFTGQSPSA